MADLYTQLPLRLLRDPLHLIALGFGSGYAPRAPGTVGTVVGIVLYVLASPLPIGWYVGITTLAFVIGIWVCGRAARHLGVADHPAIVWDEVVGYLVTMAGVPPEPVWIVAGFLLFRVLDILKPWPVQVLDRRLKGGLGIMLDDAGAGLMSLAILQGVAKLAQY